MREPPARRVALLCAQVPAAIVTACGLEPWHVTGREEARPDPALPQNLCSLVRRAASLLCAEKGAAPAAILLADSCYPLLRLHDHLQARPGTPPVLLLRVPRKRGPDAVGFLREELRRLAHELEAVGGRSPDAAALSGAIAAAHEERRSHAACQEALLDGTISALTPELLRGLEAGADPPDAAAAAERPDKTDRPRLLLAGSCFVSGDLLRLLDELGAAVVAVDACGFARHGDRAPSPLPDGDPWTALASLWLSRPPCPRAEDAESRAAAAAALAARGAIDAVLYLHTACCTPQGYDLARWRRSLRAAGVPFCAVEADGPRWDQPRLATRLEAFVESLARRGRAGAAR